VQFLNHGAPIGTCTSQPLFSVGTVFEASCTVTYSALATHSITAAYNGDANFSGSSSSSVTVPVKVLGTINAPLRWTFASTNAYTKVLALSLTGTQPLGSSVRVSCRGGGCPFAKFSTSVATVTHCQIHKGKRQCTTNNTIDLAKRFAKHKLKPGAVITVDVVRYGWSGRYYTFQIRSKRAPKVVTGCLEPGTTTVGACLS
jgi:hypothetical protein